MSTITVRVTNDLGQTTVVSRNFTIAEDAVPITNYSEVDGKVHLVVSNASTALDRTFYKITGGYWQEYIKPFALASGTVEWLTVRGGYLSEAVQAHYMGDFGGVAITITPHEPVTGSTATITGTMSTGATVSLRSGATLVSLSYPTANTWSMNVSGLVSGNNTITVRATAPDWSTADASMIIVRQAADTTAPTTTASPAAGSYNGTQSVTLTANEPATIYYTLDGTDPTYPVSGTTQTYSGAISVTSTKTIKFRARDTAGNLEAVRSATYTITASSTSASLHTGTYTGTQTVTLTAAGAATIYYTTDGSTPTYPPTGSTQTYSGPITISSSTVLKFFGRDGAGNNGSITTETYTIIAAPAPSAPTITFDATSVLMRLPVANLVNGDSCIFEYQIGGAWYTSAGTSTFITNYFEVLVSRGTLPRAVISIRGKVIRGGVSYVSASTSVDLSGEVASGVRALHLPNGLALLTVYPPTDAEALRMVLPDGRRIGLQLIPPTDDAAGAIRIKIGSNTYAIRQ